MPFSGSVRSIGRAVSDITAELKAAGIESARIDAELLVGLVTGKDRTRLAIDRDEVLSQSQELDLGLLVARRRNRESMAYIAGTREFFGFEFAVGPGVLVPRPETELLVERAIATIQRRWPAHPVRVLDLCTGSGAIALSLARSTEPTYVSITASDVSAVALGYARKNRQIMQLDDRVSLVRGDVLSWTNGPWDMILTNPPYLHAWQIDENTDLHAEPRIALDGGGVDGLDLIEIILDQAVTRVAAAFAMIIELDPDQADAVQTLAAARFPGADVIIIPDLTGRDRFVHIERLEAIQ